MNYRKLIFLLVLLVMLTGCNDKEANSLKIAEQYGLAYAPVTIIKEKGLLEEIDPTLQVEWLKLSNTAAIRESMVGDGLDIGFMGIPPYIINKDNGMEWQAFTGLSSARLALMTNDASVDSIELIGERKIILPQPGSIQHILLSMAAEKELGDAKYFDNQLVSMKHPDGMQVMAGWEEDSLHFTSPPFTYLEEQNGSVPVIDGFEAFGGHFTFIIGVAQTEKMDEKAEAFKTFEKALDEAYVFIENNKEETLDILSEVYGMDQETLEALLYSDEVTFSREIDGMETFSDFLYYNGYVAQKYDVKDLIR